MRTSGHADVRASSHVDVRASGHADVRASGHAGVRAIGHVDVRVSGHADLLTCERVGMCTVWSKLGLCLLRILQVGHASGGHRPPTRWRVTGREHLERPVRRTRVVCSGPTG